MQQEKKMVLKITDVPFLETEDSTMRDSFLITENTCGAQQVSAGLVFVPPRTQNHEDIHHVEEFFYIIQGRGQITYDGAPLDVEAGDFVFMPAGVAHRVINNSDEPYVALWAIMCKLSELPDLESAIARWHEVEPGSGWSQWPFLS
jgi:mannose-6-phosphate isomerase-like protein (cupin superfamily)